MPPSRSEMMKTPRATTARLGSKILALGYHAKWRFLFRIPKVYLVKLEVRSILMKLTIYGTIRTWKRNTKKHGFCMFLFKIFLLGAQLPFLLFKQGFALVTGGLCLGLPQAWHDPVFFSRMKGFQRRSPQKVVIVREPLPKMAEKFRVRRRNMLSPSCLTPGRRELSWKHGPPLKT